MLGQAGQLIHRVVQEPSHVLLETVNEKRLRLPYRRRISSLFKCSLLMTLIHYAPEKGAGDVTLPHLNDSSEIEGVGATGVMPVPITFVELGVYPFLSFILIFPTTLPLITSQKMDSPSNHGDEHARVRQRAIVERITESRRLILQFEAH